MMVNKVVPGPGQESVWDYPRPPKLEKTQRSLRVIHQGIVIAETIKGYRVLETSHPPVYYFPPEDVNMAYLIEGFGKSFCEWKGLANYYNLKIGDEVIQQAAWTYHDPSENFQSIKDYLAFYPGKLDACYVDEEKVAAQPGDFYGGWITSEIVGPFKGITGSWNW